MIHECPDKLSYWMIMKQWGLLIQVDIYRPSKKIIHIFFKDLALEELRYGNSFLSPSIWNFPLLFNSQEMALSLKLMKIV